MTRNSYIRFYYIHSTKEVDIIDRIKMIVLVLVAALIGIGLVSKYMDSKQTAELEEHLLSLPVQKSFDLSKDGLQIVKGTMEAGSLISDQEYLKQSYVILQKNKHTKKKLKWRNDDTELLVATNMTFNGQPISLHEIYVIKTDLILNETTVKPEFVGEITDENQKLSISSLPPKALSYKAIPNHSEIYLAAEVHNGQVIAGLNGLLPNSTYVVAGSLEEIVQSIDSHNSDINWTIILAPILAIFFIGYIFIGYSKRKAGK
nr:hypothetical protein [Brevibacillus laterosporus]